jgi:hypothetical protein
MRINIFEVHSILVATHFAGSKIVEGQKILDRPTVRGKKIIFISFSGSINYEGHSILRVSDLPIVGVKKYDKYI